MTCWQIKSRLRELNLPWSLSMNRCVKISNLNKKRLWTKNWQRNIPNWLRPSIFVPVKPRLKWTNLCVKSGRKFARKNICWVHLAKLEIFCSSLTKSRALSWTPGKALSRLPHIVKAESWIPRKGRGIDSIFILFLLYCLNYFCN